MSVSLLTLPYPPGRTADIERELRRHRDAAARLVGVEFDVRCATALGAQEWVGEASVAYGAAARRIVEGVREVHRANANAQRALHAYLDALSIGQRRVDVAERGLRAAIHGHNAAGEREIEALTERLGHLLAGPLQPLLGDLIGPLRRWSGVPVGAVRTAPSPDEPTVPPAERIRRDLIDLGWSLAQLLRDLVGWVAGIAEAAFRTAIDAVLGLLRDVYRVMEAAERALAEVIEQAFRTSVEVWWSVFLAGKRAAEVLLNLALDRVFPRSQPPDETAITDYTKLEFEASVDPHADIGGSLGEGATIEIAKHADQDWTVDITAMLRGGLGIGELEEYLDGVVGCTATYGFRFHDGHEAQTFFDEARDLLAGIAAAAGTPVAAALEAKLAFLLLKTERSHSTGIALQRDVGIDEHAETPGVDGAGYAGVDVEGGQRVMRTESGDLEAGLYYKGSLDLSAAGSAGILAAAGTMPTVVAAVHLDGEASAMLRTSPSGQPQLDLSLEGTATAGLNGQSVPVWETTDGVQVDARVTVDLTSPELREAARRLVEALAAADTTATGQAMSEVLKAVPAHEIQVGKVHRTQVGVHTDFGSITGSETEYHAAT